ncbi:hypothetical protein H6788_02670 [Candidatus Nomurabacteria bacterium]|nr:hypothetical protein [Candidatus Nomurabacteria bacterium]MCB9819347.1 hypothetical protein [Candidatus Nomurabacteria bacterium]
MEFADVLSFVQGWILLLASFGIALGIAMFKGRQGLINVMMGMYFGLFLHSFFPFTNTLIEKAGSDKSEAMMSVAIFVTLSILGTILFSRLMPREYLEGTFESLGKKIFLAVAAMVLVMTLCLHYLPVGEIINIGTPIPEFLLTEKLGFLWLVIPLAVMFLI